MKRMSTLSAILASAAMLSARAVDHYVDNVNGSEDYDGLAAVYDGTHGPKARIQSAVELAESGTTVWVAPGVYGDDQGVVAADGTHHACRVYVTKAITVKATGGKDVTHLVGRWADDSTTLCGAGAVAGFVLEDVDGGPNASVIEGFTIRDCATTRTGTPTAGIGTGVAVTGKRALPDFSSGPWVVDCVVSNCAVGYGAVAYVNAARTKIAGNRVNAKGNGSASAFANLVWCVITGNSNGVNVYAGNYLVNCTQVNNAGNAVSSATSPANVFNSIVVANGSDDTKKALLKRCVSTASYTTDQKSNGSADGGNQMKAGLLHVAAPLLGDFRPVVACDVAPSAKACGLADPSLLDIVPEAYRLTDYLGNAVTPDEDGNIHAGAVQTPMTPVAGVKVGTTLTVDGQDAFATQAVMLDSWPRILRLGSRLDAAKTLFFFSVPDEAGGYRFPDPDGTALFVPFPGVEIGGTASAVAATHELFVDADAADGGDGTSGSPFATIQAAVDAVPSSIANYALIHVAPGVYDRGEMAVSGEAISNRVTFAGNTSYRVIATEGPESTVIKGASDPSDAENGIGPAAVRCIRAAGNYPTSVEGFTLTGGRTANAASSNRIQGRGAALKAATRNAWLIGCIVSNNVAGGGSAMDGGTAWRTAFGDNPWIDGGMFQDGSAGTTLADCFVRHASGHGTNPLVCAKGVTLVHDTLVAEGTDVPMLILSAHGYVFNCVIANSVKTSSGDKLPFRGNVFWNFPYNGKAKDGTAVNVAGVDYVTRDPGFADAANGNYRLFGPEAAFGLGTAWGGLDDADRWTAGVAYTNYYRYVMRDMDGAEPLFVGGKPTPGAWQRPANGVRVTLGAASVTLEGASAGFNDAADFGGLTVRPAKGARPVLGVAVNGVTNLFDSVSDSFTLTADGLAALGGAADVVAIEGTDWYVDAVNGDDGNGGSFADDAFRTLAQAMANAQPGDTVRALPGVYGDGSMIHGARVASSLTTPITLRSRVVVPAGVTLCSVAGADETVIVGARDPDSESGLGEGAMRCVTIATNACLRGFVVTGGFTRETSAAGGDFDNIAGGGILSLEASDKVADGEIVGTATPTCWIEDCVITNNAAVTGGGAFNGSYLRCRFLDNAAVGGNGGAVRLLHRRQHEKGDIPGGVGSNNTQLLHLWYLPRNWRVRSSRVFTMTSSGVPSSTMTPSAMKITRSATSWAKDISWVTMTMVMCSSARSRITFRISPVSSGSSAEVGSSKKSISGSMASARAMATRCC